MSNSDAKFGRLRKYTWPIHRHELKLFVPVLCICFFVGLIYHIVRNMKDTLIITAASSGAEAIPFLKLWAMLPMAILWTSLFVRLSHKYSSERVFYIIVSAFLVFFFFFTFVLYPMRDTLHLAGSAEQLRAFLPAGFNGFVAMCQYWTFSLFYGMAELWGVIVFAVLFWGYINQVTPVNQAKRFYGLLGVGANIASIAAGQVSCYLSAHVFNPNWIIGSDKWHQSLILLTTCVLVGGVIIMLLFRRWTQALDKEYPERIEERRYKLEQSTEKKMNFWASFGAMIRSRYLLSLAAIVVSYNIVINLTEVLWKDQVKQLYPDPNAYNSYMGNITSYTGILSTLLAIFVAGNVVRKWGWTATAIITPIMLLITSIGFFTCYFLSVATASAALVVLFGSVQNILARASKYSVFDASKELAYVPLSKEERISGKACIDGVASRMGKSGGSLMYQGLLVAFGSLAATAPCVVCILAVFLGSWISSIFGLGKRYVSLTSSSSKASVAPAT